MRISITGDKKTIESLEAELKADDAINTESPKYGGDRTELEFGIGEIATLVAILTGAAKLIEYLIAIARHGSKDKPQKLQLKSAVGTVMLELKPDVTAAELRQLLLALEPQP